MLLRFLAVLVCWIVLMSCTTHVYIGCVGTIVCHTDPPPKVDTPKCPSGRVVPYVFFPF